MENSIIGVHVIFWDKSGQSFERRGCKMTKSLSPSSFLLFYAGNKGNNAPCYNGRERKGVLQRFR